MSESAARAGEPATRPWESHYEVERTRIVAEVPGLRVLEITLAPGQCVPWHWHSEVRDTFFCLEGAMTVETRAPRGEHPLGPGDECAVEPRTAHIVRNAGECRCRFTVVQGPGAYDYNPVG